MENEFLSYEQALALKELGFDEICFAYYDKNKKHDYFINPYLNINDDNVKDIVLAPLYQQAFRWFREKYKLYGFINKWNKNMCEMLNHLPWECKIIDCDEKEMGYSEFYNTYEEAELVCLKN